MTGSEFLDGFLAGACATWFAAGWVWLVHRLWTEANPGDLNLDRIHDPYSDRRVDL